MSEAELQAILLAAQLGKANSCPTSPEELLAHLQERVQRPASNGNKATTTVPAPDTEVSSTASGTHAGKVRKNSSQSGVAGAAEVLPDAMSAVGMSEVCTEGGVREGTHEPILQKMRDCSSVTQEQHVHVVGSQRGTAVQRRAPPEMAASQTLQATAVEQGHIGNLAAAAGLDADDGAMRHPAGFEWSFSLPTAGPRIHSLTNAQVLGAASFHQPALSSLLVSKPLVAPGSFEQID